MSTKKNAARTISVRQIEKSAALALGAPKKDVARYEKIISAYGNVMPMIVAANGDMYQLLDGHARMEACARSGVNEVPAVVAEAAGEADKAKLSLLLSASREHGCPLSEGALVEKLLTEHREGMEDLSQFVGKSKSWLSKRQTMARNLAPAVRDLVVKGAVCTRTAEEISKLPPEEQATFASNVMKEGLNKDDVCRLVKMYRSPDSTLEMCISIVESPADALMACPKTSKASKARKDKRSAECRFRGACFVAISILGEIARMIAESDDSSLAAAAGYLLKLRREMQIVGKLIAAHVGCGAVSPGKRGGDPNDC